jgi:hexose kinase, 1-phosphofructokinase family
LKSFNLKCGSVAVSTLCVTPNVALDRILVVPRFAVGAVTRAERAYTVVGGKGINVARPLASLGKANHSAGLIGGTTGEAAAQLATAEGLTATWSRVAGETRTCLVILSDNGCATVVNEAGPMISSSEWDRFEADVSHLSHGRGAICISGSLPPGCPPKAMQRLLAAAGGGGRRVWVDASGDPLSDAIEARVFAVKVNASEASAVTGGAIRTVTDALAAGRWIIERGVTKAAITLGPQGAVLVHGARAWYARPPVSSVEKAVGSGDSFLAGLIAAYADGVKDEDALRLATACGTANTMTEQAGRLRSADVVRVAAETAAHAISLD